MPKKFWVVGRGVLLQCNVDCFRGVSINCQSGPSHHFLSVPFLLHHLHPSNGEVILCEGYCDGKRGRAFGQHELFFSSPARRQVFKIMMFTCVSVPVLSEHRTHMPAISSMADNRDTRAPFFVSCLAPADNTLWMTRGIATGIEATAITTTSCGHKQEEHWTCEAVDYARNKRCDGQTPILCGRPE